MEPARWALTCISVFLLLDSSLSILLGRRYMLWGLEHMPAAYRSLIEHISIMRREVLLGIKVAEMAAGILLLWIGAGLVL